MNLLKNGTIAVGLLLAALGGGVALRPLLAAQTFTVFGHSVVFMGMGDYLLLWLALVLGMLGVILLFVAAVIPWTPKGNA